MGRRIIIMWVIKRNIYPAQLMQWLCSRRSGTSQDCVYIWPTVCVYTREFSSNPNS
jgi:hypothetical protein